MQQILGRRNNKDVGEAGMGQDVKSEKGSGDLDVASGSTHKAFPMTKENIERNLKQLAACGFSPPPNPSHPLFCLTWLPNVLSIEK